MHHSGHFNFDVNIDKTTMNIFHFHLLTYPNESGLGRVPVLLVYTCIYNVAMFAQDLQPIHVHVHIWDYMAAVHVV